MYFLKKMSIKTQLLILVVITVVTVFCLIFITYFMISKVIAKNNSEYTKDVASQIKQSISSNCNSYNRIITNVEFSSIVQKFMLETDKVKGFENFLEVNKLMGNMQELKEGILDIVILSNGGNTFYLKGKTEKLESILNGMPQVNTIYYSPGQAIEYDNKNYNCFIIISPVFSLNNGRVFGNIIGKVALIIDAKMLGLDEESIMSTSATKFYLLDRSGKVYSCNDPLVTDGTEPEILKNYKSLGSTRLNTKMNGRKYTVSVENIPQTGGKILSVVTEEKLYSDLAKIRGIVIFIFIAVLIVLSIPSFFIINNILSPLRKFMDFMSTVKSGNLKGLRNRICLEGYAEVEIMGNEFNSMLDEIDSLTHRLFETSSRLYETMLEKKQAELAFFQIQINPHFLYNTLESIKGIASVKGVPEIRKIAANFGRILRYSIKGEDVVTLREEFGIAKAYVEIQQIRFMDRIEVIYQFEEAVLDCRVIKMVLQPVIENAIFHGLEPKMDSGRLWIGGKIKEDADVIIWVRDDGVGMSPETLSDLRDKLLKAKSEKYSEHSSQSSIGILNVNNRIRLTYGEPYGITINSVLGGGTEVLFKIPGGRCL